jgi:enoyl-CoA hydratase
MNPTFVQIECPQPGCAVLTLNRPEALNALSGDLCRAIVQALDSVAGDSDLRVVVLTGAGRAFCAGLDLNEIGAAGVPVPGGRDDPVAALQRFPLPVIGAINGAAVTGGFELALACDFLIASEAARFADTHARIGVMPGWGLSQKLSRLIGKGRAKEMSFSGNFVDAHTALQWGLVNRVVAADELLPSCLSLAADISSALPAMLRNYKRLIDEGFELTLVDGMALERRRCEEHIGGLRPADLAERSGAVISRGRSQTEP